MRRSIRRTLVARYAVLLVLVLLGFGTALSWQVASSLASEADADLGAHSRAIAGALEPHGRAFDLDLPAEFVHYFDAARPGGPYYVIWDSGGRIVDRSSPDLDVPRPDRAGARDRDGRREIASAGPVGSLVLVGRDLSPERHRVREFVAGVAVAGSAVLALALAAGWWSLGRVLRPIERIAAAASAVSASNLSGRIDPGPVENELATLARVLNEAFDRLERAFERQARFTADASHELRTPLAIALTHLELASKRERTAAEYREAIETSLRALRRMRSVVDGLLTLARADAAGPDLAREPVRLDDEIRDVAALLAPLATDRRIEVALDLEAVVVPGDRERLREVVANLVSNAIHYNRPGGRVAIALAVMDGSASLAVRDTGVGIPIEDHPRVFERFFRVDRARSREHGGSGLGLSIARWIVEAHGGRVEFESEPGAGSTFRVRLPMS